MSTEEHEDEVAVKIIHGNEVCTMYLSSLLECIRLFELKYTLTPQQGYSSLTIYGPNKVFELEIIKKEH
jgi:hypothetical protein